MFSENFKYLRGYSFFGVTIYLQFSKYFDFL